MPNAPGDHKGQWVPNYCLRTSMCFPPWWAWYILGPSTLSVNAQLPIWDIIHIVQDLFAWPAWGLSQLTPTGQSTFASNMNGLLFESHYSGIGFHEMSLKVLYNTCVQPDSDFRPPHIFSCSDISTECRKILCSHLNSTLSAPLSHRSRC
jgi:hypothetical protein